MKRVFDSYIDILHNFTRSIFSHTACGGHLVATNEVRHLYSHARYGVHNYDHRTDCDWAIEAPPGKNVHLTFVTFQLESESDCNYDFVEVYSGLDTSGLLYGRFCGNSVSLATRGIIKLCSCSYAYLFPEYHRFYFDKRGIAGKVQNGRHDIE